MNMTMEAYQTLYCSSVAFGMRKALQAEQGREDLIEKVEKLVTERDELEKVSFKKKLRKY